MRGQESGKESVRNGEHEKDALYVFREHFEKTLTTDTQSVKCYPSSPNGRFYIFDYQIVKKI